MMYIDYIGRMAVAANNAVDNNLNAQLSVSGDLQVGNAATLHLGYDTDYNEKHNLIEYGRNRFMRFGSRTQGYFGTKAMGYNMDPDMSFTIYEPFGGDVEQHTMLEVHPHEGTFIRKAFIGHTDSYLRGMTDSPLVIGGRVDMLQESEPFQNLPHPTAAGIRRSQLVLSSELSDIVIASTASNYTQGSTLSFASGDSPGYGNARKFVIGQRGGGDSTRFLVFGYSSMGELFQPEAALEDHNMAVTIDGQAKRLGIGTARPSSQLHVHSDYDAIARVTAPTPEGGARLELGLHDPFFGNPEDVNQLWMLMGRGADGFHLGFRHDSLTNDGFSMMHVDHLGRVRIGLPEGMPIESINNPGFGTNSYPTIENRAKLAVPSHFGSPDTDATLHLAYQFDWGQSLDNVIRFGAMGGFPGPGQKDFQFLYRHHVDVPTPSQFGKDTFAFNLTVDDAFAVYRDQQFPLFEVDGSSGSIYTSGDVFHVGGVFSASDATLKENIEPLSYGLDEVMQLNPVSYNWKHKPKEEKKSLGLLAQDIDPILSEVVAGIATEDGPKMAVQYDSLVPVLINAIKELNARIDQLENRA